MTARTILRISLLLAASSPATATFAGAQEAFTRADTLRGSNGPARAWWDVTFYGLEVTLDPSAATIAGRTVVVFDVLAPGTEIQIDLQRPLVVDSVLHRGQRLDVRSDGAAHFATLREPASVGATDTVVVHYHGAPRRAPNAPWDGGLVVSTDSLGRPWLATANQGLGASVWWPNKDTQADEPEAQRIAVTVPTPLVNVSNGRLRSVRNRDDGMTTWEWFVDNPINNYNVTLTVGHYGHLADVYLGEGGVLTLDYWPLDYHEDAARRQFAQVVPVLACFEHWFGPYPWYEDGFKLIETPHLGMEHQSAIAYGNEYRNGYLGRDLSGTGLGLEWDFIIVHEAAHEWWGNNITSADLADMWIHESFGNYAESLYTECMHDDRAGAEYVIGTRGGIRNDRPIVPAFGVNAQGSGDMYSKGGNMLHTIRQLVADVDEWRGILRGLNETFRHRVVTGWQVREYMSERAGIDLDPVFRQYLETTEIPVFAWRIVDGRLDYRWEDAVDGFDMAVEVAVEPDRCVVLSPTLAWQTHEGRVEAASVAVDRDYYVRVRGPDGSTGEPTADCATLPRADRSGSGE